LSGPSRCLMVMDMVPTWLGRRKRCASLAQV
jgi:hypothetical protein